MSVQFHSGCSIALDATDLYVKSSVLRYERPAVAVYTVQCCLFMTLILSHMTRYIGYKEITELRHRKCSPSSCHRCWAL